MRAMERNRQEVHVARLLKKTEILDGERRTGQYELTYSEPLAIRCSVSASRGQADTELFGVSAAYDRTVLLDGDLQSLGLDESSILWIDRTPEEGAPHDYTVYRVARSLNFTMLAVQKVEARNG